MKRNALVAQSGGPSPVINASLQGVIDGCLGYSAEIGQIFAGWHGIEGVLLEELIDMKKQAPKEIALLKHTPAAGAIGTCRYKLGASYHDDFRRVVEIFRAHNIGVFFYIGGNDSMETADILTRVAKEMSYDLTVVGVPKTIDNDVGDDEFKIIDHTPGYASCARYWANIIQNVEEENRGMHTSECVAVLQAMGRKSGWITAASRLADPNREMPLQLYMAETNFNLEILADKVSEQLKRTQRCIVVVNEGFGVGQIGAKHDAFGHIEYGASEVTASQAVVNYLHKMKLGVRGQPTGQLPGVLQRGVSIYASKVDISEAYEVGRHAVKIAFTDGTGYMATILRKKSEKYEAYFDKVPLGIVANSVRYIPKSWISADGIDVTDDFVKYAKPLIGDGWPDIRIEDGLQRFARIKVELIDKKLPAYVPCMFRE